jgi:phosphoribosylglycinamide formyltransferase 2
MDHVPTGRKLSLLKKKMKILLGELGKELQLPHNASAIIAVDSYENAPAMQVAHGFEVINMLDGSSRSNSSKAQT